MLHVNELPSVASALLLLVLALGLSGCGGDSYTVTGWVNDANPHPGSQAAYDAQCECSKQCADQGELIYGCMVDKGWHLKREDHSDRLWLGPIF